MKLINSIVIYLRCNPKILNVAFSNILYIGSEPDINSFLMIDLKYIVYIAFRFITMKLKSIFYIGSEPDINLALFKISMHVKVDLESIYANI